ncbi:MAG: putative recombination and repair protein [Prokaryotic dsDNA virus sp.]|nr:MAG: putative recombination and repair protein [Prokaryotic dsDNA virus sp.]
MDVKHFFGKSVYDRTEPPKGTRAKPVFSETVEDFYYNITDALKKGVPFIYVLDSQDSLDSAAARKKFNEQKKASESEKDSAGSYGDGKAKYHSENIRRVITGLRKTGSILIIIGQTRDNLGFGFQKKTRSGGKSLRFYAHVEMWTSVEKTLKKRVRKKDRTIGNRVLVEVKKNRVSGKIGKDRAVRIPILVGHGIDDVGSCVDYLIEEEHWKKSKGQDGKTKYLASEFDVRGGRDQLVRYVEENDLEKQLAQVVADVWMEIEDACAPKRKMKYNKQHGTSQD